MLRTVLAHLRAQWMGALALFLVIAGGTAYAANTVGSSDIIDESILSQDIKDSQVKTADLVNNAVRSNKVADESLTGADIQNQSGVDTCVLTTRLGSLCVRAENSARLWRDAMRHCANLDLRVPSLGEALQLATTHDIPNVDEGEFFWTDEASLYPRRPIDPQEPGFAPFNPISFIVNDKAEFGQAYHEGSFETVCVMTPTN
jgi:hypothetical protein